MTHLPVYPEAEPVRWFHCSSCGTPLSHPFAKSTPKDEPLLCGECVEFLAEEANYECSRSHHTH